MTFQQEASICSTIFLSAAFIADDNPTWAVILGVLWMIAMIAAIWVDRVERKEKAA